MKSWPRHPHGRAKAAEVSVVATVASNSDRRRRLAVEQWDRCDESGLFRLPAKILRRLLRDAVEGLLPPDALRAARVAEESERVRLIELAEMVDDAEAA